MKRAAKPASRLHSKNPADAAWRARQAHVDADIEGLPRNRALDRLMAEMRARGLSPRERIKALVNHNRASKGRRFPVL